MLNKLVAFAMAALCLVLPAAAQVPQGQPVYETRQELPGVLASVLRAPGTYNSADMLLSGARGIICTFNQTANVPTPSTTVALQFKDPTIASTYYTVATTAAVTTTNATVGTTQAGIIAYPGFSGTPPTGFVGVNIAVPLRARIQMVIAGTGSSTAQVGCTTIP
jgi:4-amino-4-deoxy-L-arabinose transferase-like glycosyltransferase